jgi:coenzyme F420-0:L-glutamate ligase/coenzyme F420-1:gamma-L-glutamate ligase
MPLTKRGDDIAEQIVNAAKSEGIELSTGDILVIAQKIISKSEGRIVNLETIEPTKRAEEIAKASGKDPRHVETILRESSKILRLKGPHIIVQTHHGFVCANAGVDKSNVENANSVAVLPTDPDRSAQVIRQGIRKLTDLDVAVIVSDTFGRAWRNGQVNVAIGIDGLKPVIDYRGTKDMFGYVLNVTQMAVADELASAAELVMKKSDRVPVAIIRGVDYANGTGSIRDLIRPEEEDLFR